MKKLIALTAALTLSNTVIAWDLSGNTGYKHDYSTGNTYNTMTYGNTSITNGYNIKNGTSWSSRTYGSQSSGRDSKGNFWQYNADTGFYSSTDGAICTGKGRYRNCTRF